MDICYNIEDWQNAKDNKINAITLVKHRISKVNFLTLQNVLKEKCDSPWKLLTSIYLVLRTSIELAQYQEILNINL